MIILHRLSKNAYSAPVIMTFSILNDSIYFFRKRLHSTISDYFYYTIYSASPSSSAAAVARHWRSLLKLDVLFHCVLLHVVFLEQCALIHDVAVEAAK